MDVLFRSSQPGSKPQDSAIDFIVVASSLALELVLELILVQKVRRRYQVKASGLVPSARAHYASSEQRSSMRGARDARGRIGSDSLVKVKVVRDSNPKMYVLPTSA